MARRKEGDTVWPLLAVTAVAAICCLCHGLQLPDVEKQCIKNYRVLYPADNKCYSIGVQGPCQSGEVLYLDDSEVPEGEEVKVTPVCKRCRCCDAGSTAVFWNATGECLLTVRDGPRVCPHAGTVLRTDLFGYGECGCISGHARLPVAAAAAPAGSGSWGGVPLYVTTAAPTPASTERCWPLFERGPCARGEVVLPAGECGEDPCLRENSGAARGRRQPRAPFVLLEGRCRQLGSACPQPNAPKDAKVGLSSKTNMPACVDSETNVLSLIDPPLNCQTGPGGNKCEQVVNVPKDSKDYYNILLQAAENKRKKRRARFRNSVSE